tara:strand:- start:1016 stop:1807 length:792 start_codon:yes stop_codon:yes gene_type:complete
MDFNKIGRTATESDNQSVDKKFERELPKAGIALMRFIGYIETGRHEPRNPQHKPALKTQLIFELSTPKHLIEMEGKKVPQKFTLRLNKGLTAKSGYKKVFNMMNKALGGGHTHFFQMLGKPLLGEIFHNTSGEGDKKQTYANLDDAGAFSFKKPVSVDALTDVETPIQIMEQINPSQGFLWENESISDEDYVSMWESLFIEGTYEKDGKDVSKNWIQESIQENMEWEGSTLQALTEEHVSLDELETDSVDLAAAAESDDIVAM